MQDLVKKVTILVLVETPLQLIQLSLHFTIIWSHNPCFSGNSFTIEQDEKVKELMDKSQSLF